MGTIKYLDESEELTAADWLAITKELAASTKKKQELVDYKERAESYAKELENVLEAIGGRDPSLTVSGNVADQIGRHMKRTQELERAVNDLSLLIKAIKQYADRATDLVEDENLRR